MNAAYKRVLLKISGEALMGSGTAGSLDHSACEQIAREIKEVYDLGVQVGIVIGGGNIFRGNLAQEFGLDRTPADHIGMLATAINGLLLSQSLAKLGCKTRVMSALCFDGIVDTYNWSQASLYLDKGIALIFVGGTGNPYFTTDTAAAMRASEMGAEVLIKLTKVDGVFDRHPDKPGATMYKTLSYNEALEKDLKVMDATALALCRENRIPIHVCNLFSKGALLQAITAQEGGTLVGE